MGFVGELSNICFQIVLKCLYLARIGRPDIPWSVNKFPRAVTKWTTAGDKRLARLISDIHDTSEFKQYCHVGNSCKDSAPEAWVLQPPRVCVQQPANLALDGTHSNLADFETQQDIPHSARQMPRNGIKSS